jgi:hypothetical protein
MKKITIWLLWGFCLTLAFSDWGQSSRKKKRPKRLAKTMKKQAAAQCQTGIEGQVFWQAGNWMPSPDQPAPSASPVRRTLYIYALCGPNDARGDGTFYSQIDQPLIATVQTDAQGKFCVALPAGWYSVFSKEDKGLYANFFDGQNHVAPVEVKADQRSQLRFEISYNAVF